MGQDRNKIKEYFPQN